MRTALLCLAALLCATGVSSHAQEKPIPESEAQANQLSEPGTWVKYQLNHTYVLENQPEQTWTLEIKFLDRVEIDHKFYRWIEFQQDHQAEAHADWQIGVQKFLLPESALLAEPSPYRLLEKEYSGTRNRNGDWFGSDPTLLTKASGGDYEFTVRISHSYYVPFLQGLKSRRKLSRSFEAQKTVPYQRGAVKCTQRLEGTLQGLELDERKRFLTSWDSDYQLWISDQVPLGIAEAKIHSYRTEYFENPQDTLVIEESKKEIYLIDFGTGAKSALPDSK